MKSLNARLGIQGSYSRCVYISSEVRPVHRPALNKLGNVTRDALERHITEFNQTNSRFFTPMQYKVKNDYWHVFGAS